MHAKTPYPSPLHALHNQRRGIVVDKHSSQQTSKGYSVSVIFCAVRNMSMGNMNRHLSAFYIEKFAVDFGTERSFTFSVFFTARPAYLDTM